MAGENVKYLLDTHAIFWLVIDSPKLGKRAKRSMQRAGEGAIAIADITLFELAQLDRRGTIALAPTAAAFLADVSARCVVLPVVAEIAADAAFVALPQGDPFDRLIVATARHHELVLPRMATSRTREWWRRYGERWRKIGHWSTLVTWTSSSHSL